MNRKAGAPTLVAHRGYAARYPENTLEGITAAMQAGARYIEVDIQLSADGVPILFHDADLARTTNASGPVMEYTLAQLRQFCAGEPARFGAQFSSARIPTLDELITLLSDWPSVTVFLELKEESLAYFNTTTMTDKVLQASSPLAQRRVLISYSTTAIEEIHERDTIKSGWVLRRYDDETRRKASALAPHYLICNFTKLPPAPQPLWPGPWTWVLYEITDPALARRLYERGAGFIESMDTGAMMKASLFKRAE